MRLYGHQSDKAHVCENHSLSPFPLHVLNRLDLIMEVARYGSVGDLIVQRHKISKVQEGVQKILD